jgi:L-arabinose isomerase
VVAGLNGAADVPVTIVWKPVLKDSESIRRIVLDLNHDDKVIGAIAWMHTFSPAKMWIAGLTLLQKPLLHLATQANIELPWSTIDTDFMNLNQSAHGDREFGYILTRLGVSRTTVFGHVSDPSVTRRVGEWERAAAGWTALHELKVVRFGDNMRDVAVTEADKTEVERKLGVSVNTWPVNELVEVVDQVADSDIDALTSEYEERYDVTPELRAGGGARHESLRYAAREEIGIKQFLNDHGAKAFTDTFEDLGGLRQLPGIAAQRLMEQGYGFGPEGDWKTPILLRLAKVMGEGLPGGASLMEDYTYNLVPGKEVELAAHMLEVCPSITKSRPRVGIHPLSMGDREDPVRLVFNPDAGPGVVVSLVDLGDRLRLVANDVDVIDPPHDMPKLPVARAVWKRRPDLRTAVESWLEAGGAHHTVLTTSLSNSAFELIGKLFKIETTSITAKNTVEI